MNLAAKFSDLFTKRTVVPAAQAAFDQAKAALDQATAAAAAAEQAVTLKTDPADEALAENDVAVDVTGHTLYTVHQGKLVAAPIAVLLNLPTPTPAAPTPAPATPANPQ